MAASCAAAAATAFGRSAPIVRPTGFSWSSQDARICLRFQLRQQSCHAVVKRRRVVESMAPEDEKMTRRSPLDFPVEWDRPSPGRRPDIFPQFSPMKTPLPPPLPTDPPEEDEDDEEKKEEDPDKEPDKPEE